MIYCNFVLSWDRKGERGIIAGGNYQLLNLRNYLILLSGALSHRGKCPGIYSMQCKISIEGVLFCKLFSLFPSKPKKT